MKLNNIFVVGPDGTGKTEVSTRLAAALGIPRFKCPTERDMFKDGSFKEHLAFDLMLPHLVEQTGLQFVSDRGYPCEWVYSTVFGRDTDWGILNRIDNLWAERRALHVLLTMTDYSGAREDDLIPRDRLELLGAIYENYYKNYSSCNYIQINVDAFGKKHWADDVVTQVLGFAGHPAVVSWRHR